MGGWAEWAIFGDQNRGGFLNPTDFINLVVFLNLMGFLNLLDIRWIYVKIIGEFSRAGICSIILKRTTSGWAGRQEIRRWGSRDLPSGTR